MYTWRYATVLEGFQGKSGQLKELKKEIYELRRKLLGKMKVDAKELKDK